MVVTAGYSDGSSKVVTNYTYSPTGALTVDDTSVTISYTDVGVTVSAIQGISVSVSIPISSLAVGSIVKINENGSPVEFYVAKHDYESSLNGAGRTLVVRKDVYDDRVWNSNGANIYANSDLDNWFNSTYKNLLDTGIRSLIATTKFPYTPSNGNWTVSTLARSIFALSLTELGQSYSYVNVEGSALPIASTLRIAYRNGSATYQWTRSPRTDSPGLVIYLYSNGGVTSSNPSSSFGSRPAFTLPSTTPVDPDNNIITS